MKIVCNNAYRKLLSLPEYNSVSEMFVNLNIPSFDLLLLKICFCFSKRSINSDNSLVNGIVMSVAPLFGKIWAW